MMEAGVHVAKAFNQPGISAWDISKVSAMTQMFDDSALASDECSKQEMYEAWSDVAAFTSAHDWSSAVCTEPRPPPPPADCNARPIDRNAEGEETTLYGDRRRRGLWHDMVTSSEGYTQQGRARDEGPLVVGRLLLLG